jgi:hypothetical protein
MWLASSGRVRSVAGIGGVGVVGGNSVGRWDCACVAALSKACCGRREALPSFTPIKRLRTDRSGEKFSGEDAALIAHPVRNSFTLEQ